MAKNNKEYDPGFKLVSNVLINVYDLVHMALDLFFNMKAYYHFLIKQFSCNLNKDRKQVLENVIVVDFPSNVSMKRLECQSKEAQILTWVMLSTRSSLVTQRGSPNQLRIDHNFLYL